MSKKESQSEKQKVSKYYEHFEHIPDTPENVAKALFSTPPKQKDEWEYLKEQGDSEE